MSGSIKAYDTAKGKRYRVRYRKPDKSQTDKRGFKTKRDAELYLASVTISKAKGEYIDPAEGRRLVWYFVEQWKAERLRPLKEGSRVAMDAAWRTHVEPRWGERPVASIRQGEVAAWISELQTDVRSSTGEIVWKARSAQTVRRAVFVLSGILAIAARDGAMSKNPVTGVALPAKTRKPHRYLTHEQVATLVRCADTPEHALLLDYLAYSGNRWGEAVALRTRHLNMLRSRIRIDDNAVYVRGAYVFGTPKSGKSREVAMPGHLTLDLARACEGKGEDGFVFGDGLSPLPYPHATSGWFVHAVRRARKLDPTIPAITPHDLRHTAASLAIDAGANVKAVQRMLGHASAAITLDEYTDLFDDAIDTVASKMSEARLRAIS